jgi:hypothetical protein
MLLRPSLVIPLVDKVVLGSGWGSGSAGGTGHAPVPIVYMMLLAVTCWADRGQPGCLVTAGLCLLPSQWLGIWPGRLTLTCC